MLRSRFRLYSVTGREVHRQGGPGVQIAGIVQILRKVGLQNVSEAVGQASAAGQGARTVYHPAAQRPTHLTKAGRGCRLVPQATALNCAEEQETQKDPPLVSLYDLAALRLCERSLGFFDPYFTASCGRCAAILLRSTAKPIAPKASKLRVPGSGTALLCPARMATPGWVS